MVSTSASIFAESPDHMDFMKVARTPSLFHFGSFTATDLAGKEIAVWPVTPSLAHKGTPNYFSPTYLSYISAPFTYWSGSLKYMFYFSASQMQTTRVRFSWLPSEPANTAPFIFGSGDFLSKVQDIKGDCMVAITVPYVNPYFALEVGRLVDEAAPVSPNVSHNGYLMMHVYNPPLTTTTTGDSTINFVGFIAAGEDYALHKLRSVHQLYNAPYLEGHPVAEEEPLIPQTVNLSQEFSKQFASLIRGVKFATHDKLIDGDKLDSSMRTLIKRYSTLQQYAASQDEIIRQTYPLPLGVNIPATSDAWNNFTYFSYLYLFWRGAIRYKYVQTTGGAVVAGNGLVCLGTSNETSYVNNTDAFNGAALYAGVYKPAVEFEIPYYHQIAFQPLVPRVEDPEVSAPLFQIVRDTSSTPTLFVAAGEDFMYGALSAPPIIRLST